LFVLVYGIVFAMGIYYINRLIAKGPEGRAAEAPSSAMEGSAPRLHSTSSSTASISAPASYFHTQATSASATR